MSKTVVNLSINWNEYTPSELKKLTEFILVKSGFFLIDSELNAGLKEFVIVAEKDKRIALLVDHTPSKKSLHLVDRFLQITSHKYLYLYTSNKQDDVLKKIESSFGTQIETFGPTEISELYLQYSPPFIGLLYLLQHNIRYDVNNIVDIVIGQISLKKKLQKTRSLTHDEFQRM